MSASKINLANLTSITLQAAIDERRAKATLKFSNRKYIATNELAALTKDFTERSAAQEKRAAIAEYKLSQTTEANPEYAEIKDNAEKTRACVNEQKENIAKNLARVTEDYTKQIAEYDKKMADLQSGELKVDRDAAVERANQLIEVFFNDNVRNAAVDVIVANQ